MIHINCKIRKEFMLLCLSTLFWNAIKKAFKVEMVNFIQGLKNDTLMPVFGREGLE